MIISERGLALIKESEGYLRKLPDGNCIAYRCPAGVLTLGWGCTSGIKAGMIWTPQQAEEGLRRELAGHEAAVMRLVSVDLNQNQFDSLVSFAFNVGNGALEKSTLLRKLNRGDYAGAQSEFLKWNKATVNGKKVTLRGLSIRRAKESALFAERVEAEDIEKGTMVLAQSVEPPAEPLSPNTKAGIAAAASGAGTAVVSAPPEVVTETVTNVSAWQSIGTTAVSLSTAAWANPVLTIGLVSLVIAAMIGPDIYRRITA